MTKPNPVQAARAATDLRQRAARARDAAGRFIKRAPSAEIPAQAEAPAAAALPTEQVLAEAIDLADVPLSTLVAVHDVADMLADLAAAITCQPRCYHDHPRHCVENAAGILASWILGASGCVADAAIAEARRREPRSRTEAVARLSILGRSDIRGGDRAELLQLVTGVAALSMTAAER